MNAKAVPTILATTAFLTVMASGCLTFPDEDATRHAWADDGRFVVGWSYGGHGVVPLHGTMNLTVDPASNNGTFWAVGVLADGRETRFEILFDRFSGSAPFHDGGVAVDLVEHGDSGVGDPDIPRVDMLVAGWGTGLVTVDNSTYADPTTGDERWNAHFMLVRNGVRDDETAGIWNANRSEPYNPNEPGDAYTETGSMEMLLEIETAGGEKEAETLFETDGRVTSAETVTVLDESFTNAWIAGPSIVTVAGMSLGPATYRAEVYGPDGDLVHDGDFMLDGGDSGSMAVGLNLTQFGDYRVLVTVDGVGATYNVDVTARATPTVLNLWWDQPSYRVGT